jgi:hypothetical protein
MRLNNLYSSLNALLGQKIKDDEMGGTCSVFKTLVEKIERHFLRDTYVDDITNLKQISKK